MQINNNFNRFSAPRFGMALKIKPEAAEFLKKQSMQTLEQLKKAGEEMADFKHWDLEVGQNGYRVKAKQYANAYIKPTINETRNPHQFNKSFDDIQVDVVYDGSSVTGPKGKKYTLGFIYKNNSEACKKYDMFKNCSDLDRNINLTKELEAQYLEKERAKAQEDSARALKNDFIDNLMTSFKAK